jgi:Fur family zinc uptake transcriptional regulator
MQDKSYIITLIIMTNFQISMASARFHCEENNLRFTNPRQFVLEILLKSNRPMGAYDVLKQLGKFINNPKPPTAYRAIDFWREQGFIHKVESLNAYIACCEDHKHNNTHFLVCDDCNNVEELHTHQNNNTRIPDGFISKRTFTETHGTCGQCLDQN